MRYKSDVFEREKDFLTISELAHRTGKCYRTIHRATKDGKIKVVRFGGSVMISRAEAERILHYGW